VALCQPCGKRGGGGEKKLIRKVKSHDWAEKRWRSGGGVSFTQSIKNNKNTDRKVHAGKSAPKRIKGRERGKKRHRSVKPPEVMGNEKAIQWQTKGGRLVEKKTNVKQGKTDTGGKNFEKTGAHFLIQGGGLFFWGPKSICMLNRWKGTVLSGAQS